MANQRFRPFERLRGGGDESPNSRRPEFTGEIAVIGLGRFGSALARTLIHLGHEVLGVDFDADIVQEHAADLTHVAQADSTHIATLRQLGVGDFATAVVGIGGDIEASILTAAALVDLGIPNIWAKAITEAHGRILERVGTRHVVFPEHEMGERVAHLVTGRMLDYIELDANFALVETSPPSDMVGKTLGESGVRAKYGVTVVCIKPEGQPFTYATADTVVAAKEILLVAGENKHDERFADLT